MSRSRFNSPVEAQLNDMPSSMQWSVGIATVGFLLYLSRQVDVKEIEAILSASALFFVSLFSESLGQKQGVKRCDELRCREPERVFELMHNDGIPCSELTRGVGRSSFPLLLAFWFGSLYDSVPAHMQLICLTYTVTETGATNYRSGFKRGFFEQQEASLETNNRENTVRI